MFSVINKDEMEVCVQRDFAALNEKLEMEHDMCKEVMKRPVGRPKKEIEVVCVADTESGTRWTNIKESKG